MLQELTQPLTDTPAELNDLDKQRARQLAQQLDPLDSVATITFGKDALERITAFSDKVLADVRGRDLGEAGDVLESMVSEMEGARFDQLKADSFLTKLPLIGELFQSFGKFARGFDRVKDRLDALERKLRAQEARLTEDIGRLDGLYEENLILLKELDTCIYAAHDRLERLTREEIPALEAKARQSGDAIDAQTHRDWLQAAARLEKRLGNLRSIRLATIQTAPQIRLSQEANKMLMEDIQDIVHNTIPLWKRQFLIAISNHEKEKALRVTQAVKDYTNQQYVQNAEKLQALEEQIAANYQRGILDLDSLKEVNRLTIETLRATLNHYQEGRRQRAEAERVISHSEEALKQALLETTQ
jgi:uncharacterized protein YaaN involved in tellurite resistance